VKLRLELLKPVRSPEVVETARAEYDKVVKPARAEYDKVMRALHAAECPACPWNAAEVPFLE
jgi:hypothetical protein